MMKIDEKYRALFDGKVNQLFCYITSICDAECIQCLYKPMKEYSLINTQIDKNIMFELLETYRQMGAIKVSFLGGEPTLHPNLKEFIRYSKELGYKYVRIDTNALFNNEFLDDADIQKLDEITFSLDDYDPVINDSIRGKNYFLRCVSNIRYAIERGYNVQLTCCIHKKLVQKDENGIIRLEKMIDFAEKLGVSSINFHTLFKAHIPRDTWSGNIHTSMHEYLSVLNEYILNRKGRNIKVRFPQAFVSKDEFEKNKEYYGFCPVKLKDRALIFPDGTIRVCSLMIGSPYYVAYYDEEGIHYNESPTNELLSHDMNSSTPCTHQNKRNAYAPYVPVCVSLKPHQDEIVWLEQLQWESKNVSNYLGDCETSL